MKFGDDASLAGAWPGSVILDVARQRRTGAGGLFQVRQSAMSSRTDRCFTSSGSCGAGVIDAGPPVRWLDGGSDRDGVAISAQEPGRVGAVAEPPGGLFWVSPGALTRERSDGGPLVRHPDRSRLLQGLIPLVTRGPDLWARRVIRGKGMLSYRHWLRPVHSTS